jgi:hypothetical protein
MEPRNLGSSRAYQGFTELQLWQEYSRRKAEWAAANPGSTGEEYDKAIKRIVDELGI